MLVEEFDLLAPFIARLADEERPRVFTGFYLPGN